VKPTAPLIDDRQRISAVSRPELRLPERPEDEVIMHLERDQFVSETSRPVSRATPSRRTIAALWALRVFVVLVSLMVAYTFIDQLH
jgi:hypothetical protein